MTITLKIILSIFLLTFIIGCENKFSKKETIPIDYSKTIWLEIKGYKTPGYKVNMSVGYGGEGEECKFFSLGLGHDVSKSTHIQIDANITKDDLRYTLRYPLNFKQGKCEFWAGGIKIGMEEYNDIDSKKYPKGRDLRSSLIFDRPVLVMNLYYQKQKSTDNLNLNPLNLYCQRTVSIGDFYGDDTDEEKPFFTAICHNTTSNDGMTGIIGAYYEIDFLKKHNPLTANLLISEDMKCHQNCTDEDMMKAKTLGVTKKMIESGAGIKPATDILYKWFIPSEKLFEDFKHKHKIEE